MADLRIVDAPVLLQESITDDVKMPTGGLGNYAIRLGDLVWYVVAKEQLASKSYVDNSSKSVQDKLDNHISDKDNPHEVTKEQVGLGNVDNTADIDKPVSNAVSSAIITATTDMATKSYVDGKDNLKADKAYVDSKDGDLTTLTTIEKTTLVKAINEVNSTKATKATTLSGYGITNAYTKEQTDTQINTLALDIGNEIKAHIDSVESVESLLSISGQQTGRVVYVKSYYAGQGKGGGTFVYDASKATVNDGALVFNGWVRQLDSDMFTPYMSGCKCDGVTDDAQNLDKLNLALYRNKLKGRIVFDGDILINSELPRTENLAFVKTDKKVGVRLVSGVHYEIKSGVAIKIGNYFDNSNTWVFCAANPRDSEEWYENNPQDDIWIYGGGTIDSTGAGSIRGTHLTSRYLIFVGACTNFKLFGVTTIGGDYANIIVTRPEATTGRVYDCTFKNTLVTNSDSSDHSTVWSSAKDWKVYNNKFIENSPKAKLVSCAFESHGNQQYFYNNYIEGYVVALLQCAYLWDNKQPSKDDFYVYDNTAHTCFFMNFWFDGKRPFGHADIHNNKHYPLPYFTPQSLTDAGVPLTDTSFVCSNRAFSMVHGIQAKDFGQKVNSPQIFRNNDFVGNCVSELDEQFFNTWLYLGEGIHIVNNNIKAPTIATIKNRFDDVPITVNLKDIIIKGNNLDFDGVRADKLYLDIKCLTLNNSDIEINFDNSYPTDIAKFTPVSIEIWDGDNSKGNTIKITHNGQNNLGLSVINLSAVFLTFPNFAISNKVVYDDKAAIIVTPNATNPNFAVASTADWFPSALKYVEIISYNAESLNGFVLPSKLFKNGTTYNGISHHAFYGNTSTTLQGVTAHSRISS